MRLSRHTRLKNLRDLGELITADGRRIRSNLIIRAGELFGLTSEDINYLLGKNVTEVIDLRTPQERCDKPDVRIRGIRNIHIPITKESVLGITHELKGKSVFQINRDFSLDRIREIIPDMKQLYKDMIFNDASRDQLAKVIKQVIDNASRQVSTLFHCTVGKDRTGVISAILLSILGVDEETIVRDYMESNKSIRRKSMFMYVMLLLFKRNHALAKDAYKSFMAQEEYIRSIFEAIKERFESMENFIHEGLGLSDEVCARFRNIALL